MNITQIMAMMEGSLLWQTLFLVALAIFIAIRLWRGWRLGGPRLLVGLLTLACGLLAAWFGGRLVASSLAGPLGESFILLWLVSGLFIGGLLYTLLEVTAAYRCPHTTDQKKPAARNFFGVTGLLLGALITAIQALILLIAFKAAGSLAEGRTLGQLALTVPPAQGQNATENPAPAPDDVALLANNAGSDPSTREIQIPSLQIHLARLKNSLLLPPVATLLDQVDPLPETAYTRIGKLARVLSDPATLRRLISSPMLRYLFQKEKFHPLSSDPAVIQAVKTQNYLLLLRSASLATLLNDPAARSDLIHFNPDTALDYALATPVTDTPPR